MHLVHVNRLGSLPSNSEVRLTDLHDMTIAVDCDVKPQIKQNKILKCERFLNDFESFSGVSAQNLKLCEYLGVYLRVFAQFLRSYFAKSRREKHGARTYAKSRGVFSAKDCV